MSSRMGSSVLRATARRTSRLASTRIVPVSVPVSARAMASFAAPSPVLCAPSECDPRWLSDAEARIQEVPVIEVEGRLAVCDGGSGALGHPLEYMTLDTIAPGPVTCKYCGLRYKMKQRANRYGKTMKFEA